MTKFRKCTEPFSSNKVVSKIVYTEIVVLIRQLPKLIKTVNKRYKMGGIFKFDLIAQNSWLDCGKLKVLIADFSGNCDTLNPLYFIVGLILINH